MLGSVKDHRSRCWLVLSFLPAAVALVPAILAPFVWVLWMRPPPATFRMVWGKGVILANWGNGPPAGARVDWTLGSGLMDSNGTPIPFFAVWASSPAMDWDAEIQRGHVKVPLIYVAAILAAPPLYGAWRRSRTKPPGACQKCGYDLRARSGPLCPECGTPVPSDSAAASPAGTA